MFKPVVVGLDAFCTIKARLIRLIDCLFLFLFRLGQQREVRVQQVWLWHAPRLTDPARQAQR